LTPQQGMPRVEVLGLGGALRPCFRSLLIALICSGMLLLQIQPSVQAAVPSTDSQTNGATFAVIVLADLAHIGKANAASGTTVYPGDSLDTAPGGELRLTVGGGQVYLLSDTAATVGQSGTALRATLVRGTLGFSSLTDRQFQILAPEGVVQAAGGLPAYGQVTMTAHNDIVISAYTGALVLHRGSQSLVVNAGQSFYVELVPNDPVPHRPDSPYNYHLVWRIIIIGGAAGIGYYLWQKFCESPVDPT